MDRAKRLSANACTQDGMRALERQANANFAELYAGLKQLRDDFTAMIARMERLESGARPT